MRFLSCFSRGQSTDLKGESGTPPMGSCSTAPPTTMPPMALSWQQAAASSQRMSGGKPKPVRFSPEQRKVVLAELASLEDVQVRGAAAAPETSPWDSSTTQLTRDRCHHSSSTQVRR
jgi:hypothetical protein